MEIRNWSMREVMMTNQESKLPSEDRDIYEALAGVAKEAVPHIPLHGEQTRLTSTMFGAFVRFANATWFPNDRRSFSYQPGRTTAAEFVTELRQGGFQRAATA